MDLSIVIGVVVGLISAWIVLVVVLWLVRPRDVRLRELVQVVPDIARLCRDLLLDRSTPLGVRIAIAALLLWLISPVDLIPEFIPVLGPLDDVIVAMLVLRFARRRLGTGGVRDRWRGTPEGFALLEGVMG